MKYELKEVKAISKPFTKKEGIPPIDKYGINIMITTGIVGQTYNGFTKSDNMFFELDPSDSIDKSKVKMNDFAIKYVETKSRLPPIIIYLPKFLGIVVVFLARTGTSDNVDFSPSSKVILIIL